MKRLFGILGVAALLSVGLVFGTTLTASATPCGTYNTNYGSGANYVYFYDHGVRHQVKFGSEIWGDGCGDYFGYIYVLVSQTYGGAGSHASSMQAAYTTSVSCDGGRTYTTLGTGYTYSNPPPSDQQSVQTPSYYIDPGCWFRVEGHDPYLNPINSYAYNPAWSPTTPQSSPLAIVFN